MTKTLAVEAIKAGTVIDHIPFGHALRIVKLLNLESLNNRITIGLKLTSKSLVFKDLIKIEDYFLSQKEIDDLSVFAPGATINTIKKYSVIEKNKANTPKQIKKIFICPNNNCITNHEKIESLFNVDIFGQKINVKCFFCQKVFPRNSIKEYRT